MWCQSKKYTREHANGSIVRLRQIVPEGLDSVTLEQIKNTSELVVITRERIGVTGREVEERIKVYKSHRRVTTVT